VTLFSKNSSLYDHTPVHERHRQRDGQTTCDRKTALCTLVHRAVKTTLFLVLINSSPPPQKIAMLRSATFAQLSRFLASAQFLPRSATFAQLWLILDCFCGFLLSWRHFEAKWNMEPLSTHNLSKICSCLPENCDFLTPYFFHQCHALSGLVWL